MTFYNTMIDNNLIHIKFIDDYAFIYTRTIYPCINLEHNSLIDIVSSISLDTLEDRIETISFIKDRVRQLLS